MLIYIKPSSLQNNFHAAKQAALKSSCIAHTATPTCHGVEIDQRAMPAPANAGLTT
jgi:hypothetical protein